MHPECLADITGLAQSQVATLRWDLPTATRGTLLAR